MMKVDGFEIEIFKEPVLYFISARCNDESDEGFDNRTFIDTTPIVGNISDIFDDADIIDTDINGEMVYLSDTDVVLGVIPAPVGTFRVSAWINNRKTPTVLGFEYPGILKDWLKIATILAKRSEGVK